MGIVLTVRREDSWWTGRECVRVVGLACGLACFGGAVGVSFSLIENRLGLYLRLFGRFLETFWTIFCIRFRRYLGSVVE
jgi:hypothetical protein